MLIASFFLSGFQFYSDKGRQHVLYLLFLYKFRWESSLKIRISTVCKRYGTTTEYQLKTNIFYCRSIHNKKEGAQKIKEVNLLRLD
ncbi:hypothetical protein DFQ12_2889 [Sphingobacterium detergens]|uniref:Uncharacterized protein n=1 Tax=Sphingobacterium detergens TaxID=1145106 RepID=A0A420B7F6_SPHD1|nr:hypothetical protein DFQ12_2889 [Sphingobacterium detergens]